MNYHYNTPEYYDEVKDIANQCERNILTVRTWLSDIGLETSTNGNTIGRLVPVYFKKMSELCQQVIMHCSKQETNNIVDFDIYTIIMNALSLKNEIETHLKNVGIDIRYENGIVGNHIILADKLIYNALMLSLKMYSMSYTDTTNWSVPVSFEVLYPDDDNELYSVTDDDFRSIIDILDANTELQNMLWDALVNKNEQARQWINNNTKVLFGPVEKE